MYIIGIKGMTRKKLGTKVLITLLDKREMTSIRFVDYKEQSLDDLEASSSEAKLEEN